MSELSGMDKSQPMLLDNGLPYPKPIEEEKKSEEEEKRERLKRAAGFRKEKKTQEGDTKEKKTREKKEKKKKEKEEPGDDAYIRRSSIQSWFNTFMIMNIPVIGWFYLLILALKKNSDQRKDFARAYLVYKLVFFLVALGILIVLLYSGMEVVDRLLRYMNML